MQGSFNVWTDHKKGHSKVGGTTALWMNGWMLMMMMMMMYWWIDSWIPDKMDGCMHAK